MKKTNILLVLSIIAFSYFYTACEPLEEQEVAAEITTTAVSNITHNSAKTGGNITDIGSSEITDKGVCWSTSQTPTIEDNISENNTDSNNFESEITDLIANTTYYVRAYATNNAGTAYGNELSFTTLAGDITSKAFNPSPEDGATNVPLNATLDFEINNPVMDYYEIFIKKQGNSDYTHVTSDLLTDGDPFILEANTTYLWEVAIVTTNGTDITPDTWTFTTKGN